MKEVTLYECEGCGRRFEVKEDCEACESSHGLLKKANEMLRDGSTLSEINDTCHVWERIPEDIADLTILKAYTRYGSNKRSGAGRVIVQISEGGKVITSKVMRYLKPTQSYSLLNFNNTFKYNDEESEYMAYLYNKHGKTLFDQI